MEIRHQPILKQSFDLTFYSSIHTMLFLSRGKIVHKIICFDCTNRNIVTFYTTVIIYTFQKTAYLSTVEEKKIEIENDCQTLQHNYDTYKTKVQY